MTTIDEMPLARLRERAGRARDVVRNARRRLGAVGSFDAADEALEQAERLLPGLMDRSDHATTRAIRGLAPGDRAALRDLLASDPDAAQVVLGRIDRHAALRAIERVEIYETLAAEVLLLLRALELDHAGAGIASTGAR